MGSRQSLTNAEDVFLDMLGNVISFDVIPILEFVLRLNFKPASTWEQIHLVVRRVMSLLHPWLVFPMSFVPSTSWPTFVPKVVLPKLTLIFFHSLKANIGLLPKVIF